MGLLTCPRIWCLIRRRFSSASVSDIHDKVKNLVSKGLYDEASKVYKEKLHLLGINHAAPVLASVIKACSFQQYPRFGTQLHCVCLKSGSDHDSVISNSVISMYARFSSTESARKVFDTMPQRDTVTYCCMINCYIQNGSLVEALEILKEMYSCGFVPKPELIAAVLSLCVRTGSRKAGSMIHALVVVDQRMEQSVFLSTALIDLYLKCRDNMSTAFHVFNQMEVKNEVPWTALISGCIADHNDYNMAVDLFRAMMRDNVKPNRVTLVSVLPACTKLGCIRQGKEIHGFAFRHGFHSNHHLLAALVTLYCKCESSMPSARLVFERSEVKDVVMWSAMIGGYAESRDCTEAMKLFSHMRKEGTKSNSVTLLAIVSACSHLASLTQACGIHGHVVKCGFNFDVSMGNALIHMYSKCGRLMDSHKVFDELVVKDVVSWSSLISGYGLHGKGKEALKLFQEMQERRVGMDAMAFLAILSACNHAGLVEEGQSIFKQALEHHKMPLAVEHYACYIDLLGKAGKVDHAYDVLMKMAMKPSARIWTSLVAACKLHQRIDIAEKLADQLIKSEPDNPANYTLISMLRAESGNWHGAEAARSAMQERRLNKSQGFSRIELQR